MARAQATIQLAFSGFNSITSPIGNYPRSNKQYAAGRLNMPDPLPSSSASVPQPHHALEPSAFSLEAAEQWALERSADLSADLFRLTSFWYMDWFVQHMPTDRKTRYTARLAQSENYEIAFSLTSALQESDHALARRDADYAVVGEDSRQILKDRRYRTDMDRTALIDLVFGHLSAVADDQVICRSSAAR